MTPPVPKLPGRYKILGKLGSGGMGAVYRVHDKDLDNVVALKVLHVAIGGLDEQIVRFNKEARACARLRHPNIIGILDFGFYEGTTPYMVLEYVEGHTLRDHIAKNGPLSSLDTACVFKQISEALAHAHGQNVIHRDLKSNNILVSDDGNSELTVKLFDFGIARFNEDLEAMKLTATHSLIGTPNYMSPEQINHENIDARSDLYSLGCVMFEALTGHLPFEAPDVLSLLELQLHGVPPRVGDAIPGLIDSVLETIIDKCLEKNPEDRIQSAAELSGLLSLAKAEERKREQETSKATAHQIPQKTPHVVLQNFGKTSPGKILLLVGIPGILLLLCTMGFMEFQRAGVSQNQRRKINWLRDATTADCPSEVVLNMVPDFQDVDIKTIPNDGTVKSVDVSAPNYGGKSTSSLAFKLNETGYRYISKKTRLVGIKVHGGELSKQTMTNLSKMPNLESLDVKESKFEDKRSILRLKNLKHAVFSTFSADDITMLNKLKIEQLDLKDGKIDARMIDALSTYPNLRKVVFDSCQEMNGKALLRLKASKNISGLWIERTPKVLDDIDAIIKLNQVTDLRLKNCGVTDVHAAELAKMSWLEMLQLEHSKALTDAGLEHLARLPRLHYLSLRSCGVSDAGIKKFEIATHGRCEVNH
ncbi:MAG: protein kinase [Candidatus Melainabacteria bacterium]|nr:protein kinase [Candidatus Melainabacteria bacterium]